MLTAMQARSLLVALAMMLGACNTYQGGGDGEATIVAPGSFRAGSGTVTSVAVLPNANKNPAAGSSDQKPDRNLYRVSLLMDNGGYQHIDVDNATFMEGQA